MPTYGEMWPEYAKQWDDAQRNRLTEARAAAQKAFANKARYVEAAQRFNAIHGTDLPWYWIPPVHYRESDFDWNTQLAQGDPLGQVSTHVPKGQGPYFGEDAWERAAIIALETDGLDKVHDWRLEKLIYYWEKYNGWGYHSHGVPSAYVWAGTDIYEGGMFVADGQWDPNARDQRVGCVAILKSLMELDDTIKPARETAGDEPAPPPPPPPPEPVPEPTDVAAAIAAMNATTAALRDVVARLERIAAAPVSTPTPSRLPSVEVLRPLTPAEQLPNVLPIVSEVLAALPIPQAKAAGVALQALLTVLEKAKRGGQP